MKKSIILAILGFAVFAAKAQKTKSSLDLQKHEIRIGYSDATPLIIANALGEGVGDAIISAFTNDKRSYKTKTFGMLSAGYRYRLIDKLQIGADVAFLRVNADVNSKKEGMVIRETNTVIVMPTVQYSYIKTPWIDFYGNASVGAAVDFRKETIAQKTTKNNYINFAFQVNPVGLRVGKEFGGFVEAGAGYKGFVSAGLSYRF